jgi:hypothetical protein
MHLRALTGVSATRVSALNIDPMRASTLLTKRSPTPHAFELRIRGFENRITNSYSVFGGQ